MTETMKSTTPWYNRTGLVILLCMIFFPVGLYGLWKSSKIAKGWKFTATAIIGLFVIMAIATDKPQAKETTEQTVASTSETKPGATSEAHDNPPGEGQADKSNKYLFESADDFKDAFNKESATNDFDLTIDDLNVKEGEVQNSFQYMFTDHLGILGSIDKANGKVKDVMMMGSGDGTAKSASNILICIGTLISTVDPTVEPKQRGEILKKLGLFDKKKDIMNLNSKTEKNGIKYSISSSKIMGLTFSASKE